MSINLEIETKAKLTKKEYESILLCFPKLKKYSQTNYYFDTSSFDIVKGKCGLRVREKNSKYELTIKVEQNEGRLEINQEIDKKEFDLILKSAVFPGGKVKEYIEKKLLINTAILHNFATITTNRIDLNYKDSLISIDETIYQNSVDYEIECEAQNLADSLNYLKEFLSKYNIKFIEQKKTKLERAINKINEN